MKRAVYSYVGALLSVGTILSACVSAPIGGAKVASRSFKAITGQKTEVAYTWALNLRCDSSTYPYNGVVEPPSHGRIDIEHGIVHPKPEKDSDIAMCSQKPIPGTIIYYTSTPGFIGTDQFTTRETVIGAKNGRVTDTTYKVSVVK